MMMVTLIRRKARENRIGRRLIILIVAFSSSLALLASLYQLFSEYNDQRSDLEAQMAQVGVLLPPIAAGVWAMDERQVLLSLESLTRMPHMERAAIAAPDGRPAWSAGALTSSAVLTRSWPLEHAARGRTEVIGTLEVSAGLDAIYGRLWGRAVAILVSNALKTFLVAAFMYIIFNRLVTRRVEDLAARIGDMVPQALMSQATLFDDRLGFPENGDEIDRLRWAYEDFGRRLNLAVQDLHDRHEDLRHEISERTRAEAELQKAVAELSRTNAELERFAYVAAHDLQEPVRGLVSFSQLLERHYGTVLGDEGRDYLRFIVGEAQRMSSLVRDLLEYGRAGGQGLALVEVDCAELVQGVVDQFRAEAEERGARIEVGPLPRLRADRDQLRQVFLNLLGNALKYGGETPHIRVGIEQDGGERRFFVADDGIGIDPAYHDYIFQVFRRLHAAGTYSGTGIGLSICRRVIEAHGGRIWVESAPGRGSIFRFTLPDPA